MKYIKVVDGKEVTIEDTNKNHAVIYEREGFKPVKEKRTKLDKE